MGNQEDEMSNGYSEFESVVKKWFQADLQNDADRVGIELWSGMANVTWYHIENHWEVNYSFRSAGGLIAEIRDDGDYMDWYCSGPYAEVSHRLACALRKEGWIYDVIGVICDEPDCIKESSCGWPNENGYRNTCHEHYQNHQRLSGGSDE